MAGSGADGGPLVRAVPSAAWPTIAAAVEEAEDGTKIQVAAGHREALVSPLILDRALLIEGPTTPLQGGESSVELPLLSGEESIIVAAGAAQNRVMLRRLQLRIAGGAPAVVIVGGCTIEECEIESAGVGVEVTSRSGDAARILRTLVHGCQVGVSLAGGAAAAVLNGSHIQRCACGIALVGLSVDEGWTDALASVAGVAVSGNTEADLRIQGWSVRERASGVVREAPPGEEVSIQGWPTEHCSVVAPTDHGPVVLHVKAGSVNATLFEDEEEEVQHEETEDSSQGLDVSEQQQVDDG